MINIDGWVKLYRKLLDKAIWQKSTAEQKSVLITIMLLASHRESDWEWQGKRFAVQPGQLITSLPSLAESAGVTIQNVRTALKRFEKYGFLTDQSTATGRLVTVVNWGIYQSDTEDTNSPPNSLLTDNQQTANRPLTAIKNYKNVKNYKEREVLPPLPPNEIRADEVASSSKQKSAETREKIRKVWEKFSFSHELTAVVKKWGVYKAEKNDRYKPQGLNSLLVQIEKHAKIHGDTAVIELIEMCMANNWAGIIWDKLTKREMNNGGRHSGYTNENIQHHTDPELPGTGGSALDGFKSAFADDD